MGQLIIDENKCKKDGICTGECPIAIIKLNDENGFPELVPGGDQMCLKCGHCVAVCPHGAMSHDQVPVEACPTIDKELIIDEHQALQFLRSRRAIRFFKDKSPDKATLKRLIEVARYAPTAANGQLVEWLVLTDRAKIKEIAGTVVDWMRKVLEKTPDSAPAYIPLILGAWDMEFDAVLRDAPALVVASAPRDADNGMVDVTLALSYFELAATTLGLGTCWAGLLEWALLSSSASREALGLPKGHPHHYPLMVGYPKAKYYRLPERKAPKITWK
ncbi:MAG: 4Fe-4S dicluster domain-containing protein [Proteobacteria bacterium]|nr:4Fe-4S dicluster domain-containing protein [Pseudomonadota bacterium]